MRALAAQFWAGAAMLGTAGAAQAQATDLVGAPEAADEVTEPLSDGADSGSQVACLVAGYDVVLRNEGTVAIPVGTVVTWEVPYVRMDGTHVLASPLDAGGQAVLTAVLGSNYLASPKPCNTEMSISADANQSPPPAELATIDFDSLSVGQPPAGFTLAVTGSGAPGQWLVQEDPDAPSGAQVLVQVSDEPARAQFPLAVYDSISAADVELSVRFKPLSGNIDQAAGLVWRYQDENNYYIARANALEGNVVAYKVDNGERTDLPLVGQGRTYGVEAEVPTNAWSNLAVSAVGNNFIVSLNGTDLFEVEDRTFTEPGRIGLWTKADSVTAFDDLIVSPLR